ncbi:MAG: hypothetical protein H7288_00770 [Kineosporiaceae bacterium]|nr:hypothetical protein [Aeromicrobium sp.]
MTPVASCLGTAPSTKKKHERPSSEHVKGERLLPPLACNAAHDSLDGNKTVAVLDGNKAVEYREGNKTVRRELP